MNNKIPLNVNISLTLQSFRKIVCNGKAEKKTLR